MNENLSVPEEYLQEVIDVIRQGLEGSNISSRTRMMLSRWCDEEQEYVDEWDAK